jgi:hypothetical protein
MINPFILSLRNANYLYLCSHVFQPTCLKSKPNNSMKTTIIRLIARAGIAVMTVLSFVHTARAQLIYSQDFDHDDSANWAVNQGSAFGSSGESNIVNFNFNYSTVGIPSAPHSAGGTTIGLQLLADVNPATQLGSVTGAGLSVSPTNFSITANFDMHADMWINYNGSGPATLTTGGGGSGSSIFYGCGYGTAGTAAQIAGTADSLYVGTCTDNGSSAQMRMYGPNDTGSYQNGAFQITGNPNSGFVYNNSTGTRTYANLAPFSTFFPATKPPQAQISRFPQQTNIQCFAGLIDFAWHDVEVQKIGPVIVYSIDNHIIATANQTDAGTVSGGYLEFLAFDINGNASTDTNFTNLNFVVFDNIRVSNYVNVVTVQVTQPNASEIGPTPGTFTISRSSAGVPLTVNYSLTGTATNGIQYQTTPTSVTFAATDTSTNVTITPIDDGIPNLPTQVILTVLNGGANYTGAGSATVFIADADVPTIDITATQPQMYERYPTDFIQYQLTRRGNVTNPLTVGLTYGGNASGGTDYVPANNIPVAADANYATFTLGTVRNPAVTGNKTVTVSVASGGGYAVGIAVSNSATIVDSDYAPATVLFSDALTSPADAANWQITYGTGDPTNHSTDFNVNFGLDLSSAPEAPISAPPGGNSAALYMTCNKNSGAPGPGAPGGVNAYYTAAVFSNNYAVRFNMNLIEGQGPFNSAGGEGAIFGINHGGTYSNWWYSGGVLAAGYTWASDGVWYYVSAQSGGTLGGDYREFTGLGGTNGNTGSTVLTNLTASSETNVYKSPIPFTSLDDALNQSGGVPANGPPFLGYDASTWSDVEIKQINGVVTLSINHTPLFTYTNTTVWTNGYLMLGYGDPLGASVQTPDAAVYYANLQVVALPPPVITSIVLNGGNVELTFTAGTGDTPGSFVVQSAVVASGAFADASPVASIISVGSAAFKATLPVGGSKEFYRIRRL